MTDLSGIFSALLTPFDEQGRVDRTATERLVAFQVRQGVNGLYVGGSSGEAMLQSIEARSDYLDLVAQVAAHRLPLIAHVGAIATADTLRLAERAAQAGYQAISAITPFYYAFSRGEVMDHYLALAEGSSLPLVVYNFPARTQGFSTAELGQLLSHPNISGIKHTSSDFFQLERLAQAHPDALLYNGYDEMCLAGLVSGAKGAIGTTYNFMGDLYVELRAHALAGRIEDARKLQTLANGIIEVLIEVGVMPGSKMLLAIMGVDVGVSLKPFRHLTSEERGRLEAAVRPLLAWREGP